MWGRMESSVCVFNNKSPDTRMKLRQAIDALCAVIPDVQQTCTYMADRAIAIGAIHAESNAYPAVLRRPSITLREMLIIVYKGTPPCLDYMYELGSYCFDSRFSWPFMCVPKPCQFTRDTPSCDSGLGILSQFLTTVLTLALAL